MTRRPFVGIIESWAFVYFDFRIEDRQALHLDSGPVGILMNDRVKGETLLSNQQSEGMEDFVLRPFQPSHSWTCIVSHPFSTLPV